MVNVNDLVQVQFEQELEDSCEILFSLVLFVIEIELEEENEEIFDINVFIEISNIEELLLLYLGVVFDKMLVELIGMEED